MTIVILEGHWFIILMQKLPLHCTKIRKISTAHPQYYLVEGYLIIEKCQLVYSNLSNHLPYILQGPLFSGTI